MVVQQQISTQPRPEVHCNTFTTLEETPPSVMATDGVLPRFQPSLTSSAHEMEEPNLDIDTLLLTAELQASDDSFLNQFLYGSEVG